MKPTTIRLLVPAVILALTCCSGGSDASVESADAKASSRKVTREEAHKQFQLLCFTCHGEHGKGDGPGAASLDPKPRNFTDAKWQASVTDKHIETIILRGGAAVGKSPAMPPQPHLKSKPELLAAIIAYVRSLKGQ